MKRLAILALAFAAACAEVPNGPDPIRLTFPDVQRFAGASPGPATRPNSEMALDFVDLAFRMESGRTLPTLTRFEGPITVRVVGNLRQENREDLAALLDRLRREARIDIRLTNNADANIVIEAVPNRTLQRAAPNAACFVVPRVQSWAELRAARDTPTLNWATLQTREKAGIFIPSDVTPQEVRDCLHEELAQALGPLNDLYRLPDSVFNDDNIHAVLTGFDMLMLRAYYAPELRSGMTEQQVASRLPGILARMNPRGQRPGGGIPSATSRAWITAMTDALGDRISETRRRQAAARAIAIGQALGWTGPREGFANYAYGRLQIGNDATLALGAFNAAGRAYGQSPVTDIHSAHIALQLAAFTLISRDAEATIAITKPAIAVARRHENAALMSLLMMFNAEALDLSGDTEAGMAMRLDSLGWALYGFGDRDEVIDRLNEIASLVPQIPPS
ncbi:DUF2927 domain-containing protein [Roseobacter sp. CCS2]|uniref:DUF2927 domain-containing protein n=1 Tax=Roseobacter sp. CCS2 TaxID=391593 RepID=UPI0000F405CB|nr:DUF2927 domain-containing protein [Roseobacter sp. CCS2]EBA11313.1 hypothetical protein RCCS2_01603 [Roseobacter sp. CCS2]